LLTAGVRGRPAFDHLAKHVIQRAYELRRLGVMAGRELLLLLRMALAAGVRADNRGDKSCSHVILSAGGVFPGAVTSGAIDATFGVFAILPLRDNRLGDCLVAGNAGAVSRLRPSQRV
jgi:hypothetical protein